LKTFITIAALCFGSLAMAQTETAKTPATPDKYYRLDFTVKELEAGKVVASHSYLTSMTANRRAGSIRSGEKVPFGNGNYQDVGTNIDCMDLKEDGEHLSLRVIAEISSAVASEKGALPLLRQTKWDAFVLVPVKKPAIIFSSDNPTSNGQMQLQLTATPIN